MVAGADGVGIRVRALAPEPDAQALVATLDEETFAVMGGSADAITRAIEPEWRADLGLAEAIQLLVRGLATPTEGNNSQANGDPRDLGPDALEAAVLDRSRSQLRKFRRLGASTLSELLGSTH